MKAHVALVTTRVGVGVQTVTGIIDHTGATFEGKFVLAMNVNSNWNTLSYQSGINITGTVWNYGMDNGVLGASASAGDIDQFFAKIVSTGDTKRYSIGDYQPDIFFGGNWQGFAYISAFRDGELDITFPFNNRGGWGLVLIVLGGDDLTVDFAASMASGTYAASGTPVAVMALSAAYVMDSTAAATTGAGSRQLTWGWDTLDGNRGMVATVLYNGAGNARGQLTDRLFSVISGAAYSGAPYVSNWGGASYDIANGYVTACNQVAFSNVKSYATSFTLRTTPGQQTVTLPIAARWLHVAATGLGITSTPDTTQAQWSIGWADGTRQGCCWYGESATGRPILGARYPSNTQVLILPTLADSVSTTFVVQVEVVSINSATGDVVFDVTDTDGGTYEVLLFALGDVLDTPARPSFTGSTAPGWTLNRFDQKIRVEGGNGNPAPRAVGRPIDWAPDGLRWKLERFDLSARKEEEA